MFRNLVAKGLTARRLFVVLLLAIVYVDPRRAVSQPCGLSLVPCIEVEAEMHYPEQASDVEAESFELPDDFLVFLLDVYEGYPLDFQIDQSGNQATKLDIVVNYQDKPVVLMLHAHEPTIWNIEQTESTIIAGVLASGFYKQIVANLPDTVPVLSRSYQQTEMEIPYYRDQNFLESLAPSAQHIFERFINEWLLSNPYDYKLSGTVVFGNPLDTSMQLEGGIGMSIHALRESFGTDVLAGLPALEEAVKRGVLRRATAEDTKAWLTSFSHFNPKLYPSLLSGQIEIPPIKSLLHQNGYVVLGPFFFPRGLTGAHARVFFVPEGVTIPLGDPGHSIILDFNTKKCLGENCDFYF